MQLPALSALKKIFPAMLAFLFTVGCSSVTGLPTAADDPSETIYEYNGIQKSRSELSGDTVKWLEWYQSLPQEQQDALAFVPSEFTSGHPSLAETASSSATLEDDASEVSDFSETSSHKASDIYGALETSADVDASEGTGISADTVVPGYLEALTDHDRYETEELVRYYYSEFSDKTGEIEVVEPAPDDFSWYQNKGIEAEYTPGNIIIYRVLTTEDRLLGNGWRIVSIARRSKSDEWKVINSGY